jgi:hypothetical protein
MKRTGRLPTAVVGLWLIVHSLKNPNPRDRHLLAPEAVPQEVEKVVSAIAKAATPPKNSKEKPYRPKARLNLSLAALRREHPTLFAEVERWLKRPEVREQFARKGHAPTWHRWVRATARVQQETRPSEALFERGRPREMRFSNYHRAALYAEYLHQIDAVRSDKATERAIAFAGLTLSRRRVQRWRRRVRAVNNLREHLEAMKKRNEYTS